MVDSVGSELFAVGWWKNACFSGAGGDILNVDAVDVSDSELSNDKGGRNEGVAEPDDKPLVLVGCLCCKPSM